MPLPIVNGPLITNRFLQNSRSCLVQHKLCPQGYGLRPLSMGHSLCFQNAYPRGPAATDQLLLGWQSFAMASASAIAWSGSAIALARFVNPAAFVKVGSFGIFQNYSYFQNYLYKSICINKTNNTKSIWWYCLSNVTLITLHTE